MEPNGCAAGARRRRPADVLRLDADAPRPARPARRGARRWTAPTSTSSRRRSAAGSAARPASTPSTRRSPRRPGSSSRPVVWVPPRSDDMQALPHSRGPDPVRRARLPTPTARSPACGCASSATPVPTRASAPFLPGGTKRMSNGTYDFRRHPVRRRRGGHQHHADGRLPRRRPPGGDGAARAPRRPRRPRARHRPDRAAQRNLLADDVFPFTTLTGNTLRHRPLHAAARRRRRGRRLRRAARRAGGSGASRGRSRCLLGIGVAAYVEITAGGGAERVRRASRSTTTARRRCSPARCRTARATRRRSPCS